MSARKGRAEGRAEGKAAAASDGDGDEPPRRARASGSGSGSGKKPVGRPPKFAARDIERRGAVAAPRVDGAAFEHRSAEPAVLRAAWVAFGKLAARTVGFAAGPAGLALTALDHTERVAARVELPAAGAASHYAAPGGAAFAAGQRELASFFGGLDARAQTVEFAQDADPGTLRLEVARVGCDSRYTFAVGAPAPPPATPAGVADARFEAAADDLHRAVDRLAPYCEVVRFACAAGERPTISCEGFGTAAAETLDAVAAGAAIEVDVPLGSLRAACAALFLPRVTVEFVRGAAGLAVRLSQASPAAAVTLDILG